MNIDRVVHLIAGILIMASAVLAYYVHPYWIGLAAFVGLNLFQSSLTQFCPLAIILKKAGVAEGSGFH